MHSTSLSVKVNCREVFESILFSICLFLCFIYFVFDISVFLCFRFICLSFSILMFYLSVSIALCFLCECLHFRFYLSFSLCVFVIGVPFFSFLSLCTSVSVLFHFSSVYDEPNKAKSSELGQFTKITRSKKL